ncbi:uncharacterized protein LOC142100273 [Mixophyes fleayi]|uniref:uncharacterized protein LOC142100273 n=1 Tax=Mixophyes fleayi TaxID=3061075 RepID=UPI003F4DCACC
MILLINPYFTVYLSGVECQTIHVSQIPTIVTPEGSSVTLPCNYSISGAQDATAGSYKWYRHMARAGPEVSHSNKDFTGRISTLDTDVFINNRSASITLHRVHVSDTGMYYCDVTFLHGGEISGHGTGTFLNVTAGSPIIHVSQIPVIVTPEGSSVTLPCNYSISGAQNIHNGSYKWYRHMERTGPEVSDSNKDFTGRISRMDTDEFIHNRSASITLHRVHVSDTGMYYCDVSFLHDGEISGHGNGTFLNVTARTSAGRHHYLDWSIPLSITGMVIIGALLVIIYWYHTKQVAASRCDVGPIIYTDFTTQAADRGPTLNVESPDIAPGGQEADLYSELP